MAIYHLSVKHGSRKQGKSAAAHARYIAREGPYAKDHYAEDFVYAESGNMPAWGQEEVDFWEAADLYERANARLYTEIEIALPREFEAAAQLDLVRDFVSEQIGNDHPVTWAVHNRPALDGDLNPHVHIMLSERTLDGIERDAEVFFKRANANVPEKGGAAKDPEWNRRDKVEQLRQAWEVTANLALVRAGLDLTLDHRSLEAQGVDRAPEPKLGPEQTAMLKRGDLTEDAERVLELRHDRAQMVQLEHDLGSAKTLNLATELSEPTNRLEVSLERSKGPALAIDLPESGLDPLPEPTVQGGELEIAEGHDPDGQNRQGYLSEVVEPDPVNSPEWEEADISTGEPERDAVLAQAQAEQTERGLQPSPTIDPEIDLSEPETTPTLPGPESRLGSEPDIDPQPPTFISEAVNSAPPTRELAPERQGLELEIKRPSAPVGWWQQAVERVKSWLPWNWPGRAAQAQLLERELRPDREPDVKLPAVEPEPRAELTLESDPVSARSLPEHEPEREFAARGEQLAERIQESIERLRREREQAQGLEPGEAARETPQETLDRIMTQRQARLSMERRHQGREMRQPAHRDGEQIGVGEPESTTGGHPDSGRRPPEPREVDRQRLADRSGMAHQFVMASETQGRLKDRVELGGQAYARLELREGGGIGLVPWRELLHPELGREVKLELGRNQRVERVQRLERGRDLSGPDLGL